MGVSAPLQMDFVCFSAWHQLPPSADRLFARGARNSLFLSRRWFENLHANALDGDQALLLACVAESEELLAVLPLLARANGSWHALSTYYTSLFSLLLADEEAPEAVLDCLADGLSGLDMLSLRLEPLAEDDPAIARLARALEARGFQGNRLFHFVNWSHALNGQSFAEYFAQRPSSLRNTIIRKRRKLEREHDVTISLTTTDDLERAVSDFNRVYQASWKDGERFPSFTPALIRVAADAGWLRLAVLYIDGQPAAAQIWFVVHGSASIFRLVYDERWQQYSPGSILTAYLMEQVIDHDRVESLDFLTGNERYKQDWMDQRRERWRLVFDRKMEPESPARSVVRSIIGWLGRR